MSTNSTSLAVWRVIRTGDGISRKFQYLNKYSVLFTFFQKVLSYSIGFAYVDSLEEGTPLVHGLQNVPILDPARM